ncbi:MAG: hypothetical protein M1419_01445, partial [Bacteroidetes bacterium]|nr:hypothetical protein [Bacteroidota bacterium]
MSVKDLNILYTTAHYPYPPIGGDRSKQYYLLKHLAENNNVTVVSLDKGLEVKSENIEEMKKINIDSYVFKINHTKGYFNAALFSPFGNPLEIEFFRNPGFRNKIKELTGNIKFDLVINYFLRTAELVKNINSKKILLSEDCRSYYQANTYPISRNFRQKMIRFYESKKLRKYESDIMNYFDVTTAVTQTDLNEMKKLNPNAIIKILTNGVDVEKYKPGNDNNNRKDIIFAGKLDFWLNRLIVERIINKILPGIKKVHPQVKFHIIGANPE